MQINLMPRFAASLLLGFAWTSSAQALEVRALTVPGATPGQMLPGELAINRADKTLYFKNVDGTVAAGRLLTNTVTAVATTGGATTLTAGQLATGVIRVTGTLTSNAVLVFPASQVGFWSVINGTSGSFTLSAQVAGQSTPVVVPSGQPRTVSSDGTTLTSPVSQASALTSPTTTVTGNLVAWGSINGQTFTDLGIGLGTGGYALCPLNSATACVFTSAPILGTGILQRQPSDGTISNGNARGLNAVDLQVDRYAAGQVASGQNSAILGGSSNTAAGQNASILGGYENAALGLGSAVTGGASNLANGAYSRGGGLYSSARGRYGADCFSSGRFTAQGDAQACTHVLRGTSTSTATVRLTADGAAAGSANCLNIPDNTVLTGEAWLAGRNATTFAATGFFATRFQLSRGAGVGTTAVTVQNGGAIIGTAGTIVTMSADTTNGCLSAVITPPSGDTWRWSMRVQTVEVQ